MSGRRSHVRFEVIPTSEGVLRLLRDVLVVSAEEDEAVVLSRDPGVVGETVMLEIPGAQASSGQAMIVECRPVIVDGTMRHRLRLQLAREIMPGSATMAVEQAR